MRNRWREAGRPVFTPVEEPHRISSGLIRLSSTGQKPDMASLHVLLGNQDGDHQESSRIWSLLSQGRRLVFTILVTDDGNDRCAFPALAFCCMVMYSSLIVVGCGLSEASW